MISGFPQLSLEIWFRVFEHLRTDGTGKTVLWDMRLIRGDIGMAALKTLFEEIDATRPDGERLQR